MKRLFRLAALIGAVFYLASEGLAGVASSCPHREHQEVLLIGRARSYLESIYTKTAHFPPEFRASAEKNAQSIVEKGFMKFRRASDFRQLMGEPTDFEYLGQVLRRCEDSPTDTTSSRSASSKAASFLANRFEQPSPWALAVRVALPSLFSHLARHGVLTRHNPLNERGSHLTGFFATASAALSSASPTRNFDAGACKKSISMDIPLTALGVRALDGGELPLTGYPSMVRTIVLRI